MKKLSNIDESIWACKEVATTFEMLKDAVISEPEKLDEMYNKLFDSMQIAHRELQKFMDWLNAGEKK